MKRDLPKTLMAHCASVGSHRSYETAGKTPPAEMQLRSN